MSRSIVNETFKDMSEFVRACLREEQKGQKLNDQEPQGRSLKPSIEIALTIFDIEHRTRCRNVVDKETVGFNEGRTS